MATVMFVFTFINHREKGRDSSCQCCSPEMDDGFYRRPQLATACVNVENNGLPRYARGSVMAWDDLMLGGLIWRYKGNTYGIYRNDDWTYDYVKLVPRNKVCGCVLVVREGT